MPTDSPPPQGKLVSIICRSVGRPELTQCLESVARQTYPHLELVLVNAATADLTVAAGLRGQVPLVMVAPGEKLSRPRAANAGLEAASGDYLMFLDEDDWIEDRHVANLVAFLEQQVDAAAVYSSTRKVDADNRPLDYVFAQDFDRAILRRDNYIPIHAMLFRASLLQQGCRFDEALAIYEDWDFWLQLAQHTDFAHLDEITACYRVGGDSETALKDESQRFSSQHPNALAREKIFEKWSPRWSGSDINQMLGSMDSSLTIARLEQAAQAAADTIRAQQAELEKLNESLVESGARLNEVMQAQASLQEQNRHLQRSHDAISAEFEKLTEQHRQLDQAVRDILNSFSWRITAPYRFLRNRIDRYLLAPLTGGLKKKPAAGAAAETPPPVKAPRGGLKYSSAGRPQIYYALESPASTSRVFSDALVIRGWAFAADATVTVSASIDGRLYREFSPAVKRVDVGVAYAAFAGAADSGFEQRIVLDFLARGRHQLELVFTDSSGHSVQCRQEFHSLTRDQLYSLWLDYQARQPAQSVAATPVHIAFLAGADLAANLKSLRSVADQRHRHWRLHFLGNNWPEVREALAAAALDQFQAQADCSADAQALAELLKPGDLLLGLGAGERLQPQALTELLAVSAADPVQLVYSDHDLDTDADQPRQAVFTPGWSPGHLMCRNYTGNIFLLRCNREALQFLSASDGGDWRYGLLLEQLELSRDQVARVPKVLWSAPPPDRLRQQADLAEESDAVAAWLSRHAGTATLSVDEGFRYIDWGLQGEPLVSIIIPTMGRLELLKPCLQSLLELTSYGNYELIMLDNSRGRFPAGIEFLRSKSLTVVECDMEFNWARLNNIGASHARGDYLLFLNDDIEVIDGHWLYELVQQASRRDVGAVGSLLLYPNGAIQHAGVFLVNHGGGCAHLFHKMLPNDGIYRRLDKTVREVSANTGACLLVASDKFKALQGFDEELAVVGNDIDFCLRLEQQGYRNIWTPRCQLIHHESISRQASVPGDDEAAMWKRWGSQFEAGDYYYNPNLSLTSWDCAFRIDLPADDLVADAGLPAAGPPDAGVEGLRPGVTLIGYIRAEMGLGEGARSDARALEAAGIEFNILSFEYGNPGRMTDLSWRGKESLDAPYDVVLMHINPDFLALAKQGLPLEFFDKRYLIAYWAWELEEIPDDWLPALEAVDEVWVPSRFVQGAVEKRATVPVLTIPHCIQLEPDPDFTREYFGLQENCFIFLAMFDTHSVAQRKNPFAAVNAFKQAFDGADDSVCLLLKTNNATGREERDLRAALGSHPNIRLLHQTQPRAELVGLLAQIDCFVSLHRSEGFGLGPAEAMSLGKATIITNWSGTTDFMQPDNCMAIDYQLVRLERDYGPYRAGQRWADPDIGQAAQAMRQLASNPELAAAIGARARATIAQSFSPAAVGALMQQRLEQIRSGRESG